MDVNTHTRDKGGCVYVGNTQGVNHVCDSTDVHVLLKLSLGVTDETLH